MLTLEFKNSFTNQVMFGQPWNDWLECKNSTSDHLGMIACQVKKDGVLFVKVGAVHTLAFYMHGSDFGILK